MSHWEIRIVHDLRSVERARWDALVGAESPFLEWDWLAGLEEAGCVRPERGWAPHHLLVESGGRLLGACPLYLKGNSEGEFVFDHEWAYAAERAGQSYYPKLLVAVPFTPANGMRLLTAPGAERPALLRAMGEALARLCRENALSSVHVNFCRADEVEALGEAGFLERRGLQYHWENRGYATFEDYLAAFRSKRRTKIRRERREMAEQGVAIRALHGDRIDEGLVPTVYRLYKEHIDKLYWGRLYLNEAFFRLVVERFRRNLCLVLAEREGRVVAGTFNVQKAGVFYGRYWGAFEEIRHLHFNVCYYAAIEHCIANGLARMEPGAGGDFKQLRGFDPRPTRSMHFFADPALRAAVERYLSRERERMGLIMEHLNAESQLKPQARGTGE
jgi:predicted N-acyltransferase